MSITRLQLRPIRLSSRALHRDSCHLRHRLGEDLLARRLLQLEEGSGFRGPRGTDTPILAAGFRLLRSLLRRSTPQEERVREHYRQHCVDCQRVGRATVALRTLDLLMKGSLALQDLLDKVQQGSAQCIRRIQLLHAVYRLAPRTGARRLGRRIHDLGHINTHSLVRTFHLICVRGGDGYPHVADRRNWSGGLLLLGFDDDLGSASGRRLVALTFRVVRFGFG